MYKLFEQINTQNVSHSTPPEFTWLKSSYLRELNNVENYYHNRVYRVKSNNFLVRLINQISTPLQYDDERFVSITETRAPFILSGFKVTSDISYGEIHNGIFYGPGVSEILVSDDAYFNPAYAANNWREICAVKPLLHPKSDLGLLLPNGRPMSAGDGLAVISINLPLLAMQYRGFCLDQITKQALYGSALDTSHFVHMYVLPNMVYAQTDIVLMNRMMNLFYGIPMGSPKMHHPFIVHDYGDKVDHVLNKVIKHIQSTRLQYSWVLKNIPAIFNDDMEAALVLPDVTPTTQAQWAMIVARLDIIKFLIDAGGNAGVSLNRTELNQIQITLKRLQRSFILDRMLSKDMLYDVTATIEFILNV